MKAERLWNTVNVTGGGVDGWRRIMRKGDQQKQSNYKNTTMKPITLDAKQRKKQIQKQFQGIGETVTCGAIGIAEEMFVSLWWCE